MLTADEISSQISAYVAGRLSLNSFEDWFRDQSRNVHIWGDKYLNDFVDAVESLFSERYFESLNEKGMRARLQEEARRFARSFVASHAYVKVSLLVGELSMENGKRDFLVDVAESVVDPSGSRRVWLEVPGAILLNEEASVVTKVPGKAPWQESGSATRLFAVQVPAV